MTKRIVVHKTLTVLTSLVVQFYLHFCYKSGTLTVWLASCFYDACKSRPLVSLVVSYRLMTL